MNILDNKYNSNKENFNENLIKDNYNCFALISNTANIESFTNELKACIKFTKNFADNTIKKYDENIAKIEDTLKNYDDIQKKIIDNTIQKINEDIKTEIQKALNESFIKIQKPYKEHIHTYINEMEKSCDLAYKKLVNMQLLYAGIMFIMFIMTIFTVVYNYNEINDTNKRLHSIEALLKEDKKFWYAT